MGLSKIDTSLHRAQIRQAREAIEKVDREIMHKLQRRWQLSRYIGERKHDLDLPIHDEEREDEVVEKALETVCEDERENGDTNKLLEPMPEDLAEKLIRHILFEMRSYSQKLFEEENGDLS